MSEAIARAESLIAEDPSAAVDAAAEALAGARADGDRATIAWALAVRAHALHGAGRFDEAAEAAGVAESAYARTVIKAMRWPHKGRFLRVSILRVAALADAGRYADALAQARDLRLIRTLRHGSVWGPLNLGWFSHCTATCHLELGDHAAALADANTAVAAYRKARAAEPGVETGELARALICRGDALWLLDRRAESMASVREATELLAAEPAGPPSRSELAVVALVKLGGQVRWIHDGDALPPEAAAESVALCRTAVAVARELGGPRPVTYALFALALALNVADQLPEMIDVYRELIALRREVAGESSEPDRVLVHSLDNLGRGLLRTGDLRGAVAPIGEALAMYDRATFPTARTDRLDLAEIHEWALARLRD